MRHLQVDSDDQCAYESVRECAMAIGETLATAVPTSDSVLQAYAAITDKLFIVSQLDIFGSFCKFLACFWLQGGHDSGASWL